MINKTAANGILIHKKTVEDYAGLIFVVFSYLFGVFAIFTGYCLWEIDQHLESQDENENSDSDLFDRNHEFQHNVIY